MARIISPQAEHAATSGSNNASGPGGTIVSCRDVTKVFDQGDLEVRVLDGVSLSIEPGQQLAVVGASGTGKSTLLHVLGGLDEPTSGHVELGGEDLSRLSSAQRGRLRNRDLGFVYQFHHLLPEFTAQENVAMPLLIRRDSTSSAMKTAADILKRVGLDHRVEHKPAELSGGERQRAAVARALVTQPRCILADEPTGNLDEKTADNVHNLMLELNQEFGTALVVVTHDMSLAARMNQQLRLHEGKLQPL